MSTEPELLVYQADNGAIELKADANQETIWATQKQLAAVFEVDVRTINEHIKNIFKTGELEQNPVIRKFRITVTDGKQYNTNHYNLDMIISVGYRVNSKTATHFRKWATKTLRQHITQGYTINPTRIEKNLNTFLHAVDEVKVLAKNSPQLHTDDVLALVTAFAHTWFSLESYDEDTLPLRGQNHDALILEADALYQAVAVLKQDLMAKSQASELFAQEKRAGSLAGILANVYQSAFGEDVYPTLEEKAANLLYFIVKNHAFNDGNKRTGAFAFIWFLQQAGIDFKGLLTPEALTAITLLIAESDAKNKDRMVGLVILLLTGNSDE